MRHDLGRQSGAAAAIERNKLGHAPGKIVLDLTR
jgi:hypothetical protein